MAIVLVVSLSIHTSLTDPKPVADYMVAGQNYQICNEQSQYLTSPYTYSSLATGSQEYTVQQYMSLSGYGSTLPTLPAYIQNEGQSAPAAVIFAPGSTVDNPQYDYPGTPLLYFFEGGAYTDLALSSVTGDEFIGGSAAGFSEPTFDDQNNAGGINAQNGTFDFSGGSTTLTAPAAQNANTLSISGTIPGYTSYVSFADGTTYSVLSATSTTITLNGQLSTAEASGATVWGAQVRPIASVTSAASQGATSVTLSSSTTPLLQYGNVEINNSNYQVTSSPTGSQSSGYTISVAKLDTAVVAGTPVYYNGLAGDVTVKYLDIADDSHNTTGTIYTGTGWTITNNNIHDGYKNTSGTPTPGLGVAIYGGDEGTVEYNCLSKMGDYGINVFGTNNKFDYNEVYESNYEPDPGCGCSGGGKWWGTLNADIYENAFVNDSPGGGGPVWLDNGNTGTYIANNYFDQSFGSAIASETGFNLDITGNLFLNGGWGNGTGGCGGDNCDGAVNINSSGGINVPNSRYENQVSITANNFINNWEGVTVWEAGGRNCENSGEGYPADAPYCSGGFPNTAVTSAGGQYYFSHVSDSSRGGTLALEQPAANGDSTVLVNGSEAINDQIGFANAASTTTAATNDVTTLTSGSDTLAVTSTAGFPTTGGQLRVGTSAAWSDGTGSWTGAILHYTGISGNTFTGVTFVRGSGTLAGPVLQVQPYQVTSETCYANDCAVHITPSISGSVSAGTAVSASGTCQLFATSAALPSGPLAPNGTSYWDGCQWQSKNIATSNNTFVFQPSLINASTPINGGGIVSTHLNTNTNSSGCTAANSCGWNFMADQYNSGELPFNTEIGSNAMMSNSSYTGCPGWDSGCTSNPLTNLNGLANPPGAAANNGEAPDNNAWINNTYSGPWTWNTNIYGNCGGGGVIMPSDPTTGKSLTPSSCTVDYPHWQADWQQDTGSTYSPVAVTLQGLTDGEDIHGSPSIQAYADTTSGNTISNCSLSVDTITASSQANPSSSPCNFSLNTASYHDGAHTIKVTGTDDTGSSSNDSVTVYTTNGDFNNDGRVDLADLSIMASHWGQNDPTYTDGNITGQSTINSSDLSVIASNWGWQHP